MPVGASSSVLPGCQNPLPSRPLAARSPAPPPHKMLHARAAGMLGAMLLRSASATWAAARSIAVSAAQSEQLTGGELPAWKAAWKPRAFPPIDTITLEEASELSHSIQLTGYLGTNFENRETKFGQVGRMILYVQPKVSDKTVKDQFVIELYQGLAEEAQARLAKGMLVHVEGKLRCDTYVDQRSNMPRTELVVETERMYVCPKRADSPAADEGYTQQQAAATTSVVSPPPVPAMQAGPAPTQEPQAAPASPPAATSAPRTYTKITPDREKLLWEELRNNPKAFWDNRTKKLNPKSPDYKHKTSGEGLWLGSTHNPGFE